MTSTSVYQVKLLQEEFNQINCKHGKLNYTELAAMLDADVKPVLQADSDITSEAKPRVLVLYSSLHGTSEQWAKTVHADVSKAHPSVMVESMDKYNFDDLAKESVVLFLISTYDGGPPPSGEAFFKRLEDFASDSRVDKTSLAGLRYKSQFEILTDYF